MPTKRSVASLELITKSVIKKNDNKEITAIKDQSLRLDANVSFLNLADGGLSVDKEAGYTPGTPIPTSPTAFATVEMLGADISEKTWITNIPNPIDGLYHRIKQTMGADGQPQYEDLGPV